MSLETATYIDSLVTSNPDGGDQKSTADDHIRLVKASLKRTFPNIAGEVSISHAEANRLRSLTVNVQAEFTRIRTNPSNDGTVAYSVQANLANSASRALVADLALTANSASFALIAATANSASFALIAATANSASFATLAGLAQSASFATFASTARSASDALALGGVAAAAFVQSGVQDTISATYSFAARPQAAAAGGFISHAGTGNNSGVVTVTSTTPTVVFGNPGDIQLVVGPLT